MSRASRLNSGVRQADATATFGRQARNLHRRDLGPLGNRRNYRQVLPAAEAPTLTLGPANSNSVIRATFNPNISADPTQGYLTYLGGGNVGHPPGGYPATNVWAPLSRVPDVNNNQWGWAYTVEFFTDADRFEYMYWSKGGSYRISVDDAATSLAATATANDNSTYDLLVDFTSVGGAKVRKIRIESNNPLWGLHVASTFTVWPTRPRGPRVIVMGDSYTGGSNMSDGGPFTWYKACGDLLGWDDVWNYGVGGTGYLLRNGTTGGNPILNNMLDQVPTVTPYSPDIVILAAGHNDTDTNTNVANQAGTVVSQLRAALPNALIVVLGPFWVGGAAQASTWAAKETAIFNAVKAAGADYTISQASGNGTPWFTGTGTTGTSRSVTDGATTSGSTTVTSATAAFVSGDVSRVVTGAGIPTGTKVSSVTNGTTAVLSAAATATATGVSLSITNQRGDGNSDRYVGTDNVHPTQPGHDYLGQRIAREIANLLGW